MIFPLSNGVFYYLYIAIKGQTFNPNQKKPNKMSKQLKITSESGKEMKFILDLLKQEPMSIGAIKNLCGRKHKRMFGYEIENNIVENHVSFLQELELIEIKKEQGGDGWNTSYEYEVFAIK